MLGRIGYDDFSPYRASGRSTMQVMTIVSPTLYIVDTLAMARHLAYLIEKHTNFMAYRDIPITPLPDAESWIDRVSAQDPRCFIEVDHWTRPMLPGRLWELITARNAQHLEATNARNNGYLAP